MNKKNILVLIFSILVCITINADVFSFFSSYNYRVIQMTTGSVELSIGEIDDGQTINTNSAKDIEFSINNSGISPIDLIISLNASFSDQIDGSTKLFLYDDHMSESQILEDVEQGATTALSEDAFSASLNAGQTVNYRFKLFFYADSQIQANPPLFDNRQIDVLVVVSADITQRQTNWATTTQITFNSQTKVNFIKTANGNHHTLALSEFGRVYAWGRNVDGQLGDGTTQNKSKPQLVAALATRIVDIAACNSSSFALDENGQLYAWGHNGYGHLGDGTTNDSRFPIMVSQPQDVKFVKVFSKFNTAGAISEEGDIYVWGYGGRGETGIGISESTLVSPRKIEGLSDIKEMAIGNYCAAALTNSGQVYAWGTNMYGQMGIGAAYNSAIYAPTQINYFSQNDIKISSISLGSEFMGAVSEDGRLFTWGIGANGVLGTGSTSPSNLPQQVDIDEPAQRTFAGRHQTAFITKEGRVYVFGDNTLGELGLGSGVGTVLYPTLLGDIDNVSFVSFGDDCGFILSNGIELFAMGSGEYGKLGNGSVLDSPTPTLWTFT